MRSVLLSLLLFCTSSVALAEEEKSVPLFAAIQISDGIIIPVAEFSEGKWQPVTFTSDSVKIEYEEKEGSWEPDIRTAGLNQIFINSFEGSRFQNWYFAGDQKLAKISRFTQFGQMAYTEDLTKLRTDWGLVIDGTSGAYGSDDRNRYKKRLLFNKPVASAFFQSVETGSIKERVVGLIHPDALAVERSNAEKNINRCKEQSREYYKTYDPDALKEYCEYWDRYAGLIDQITPEVVVKIAKLKENSSIYFANIRRVFADGLPACPRITLAQSWLQGRDEPDSVITKQITLTDCDAKDGAKRVVPIGVATVAGRTFVFTQDFDYESRTYAIREYADRKLNLLFGDLEGYDGW